MTNSENSILIGNGINLAFNEIVPSINQDSYKKELWFEMMRQRFSYEEILKTTIPGPGNNQKIFKKYNTTERDIEKIYSTLSESKKGELKNDFVEILNEMHLDLHANLEVFFKKCKEWNKNIFENNIKEFNTIYTINFDLKLYYSMLILDLIKWETNQGGYKDGFGGTPIIDEVYKDCKLWPLKKDIDFNVNYLHGAMHLVAKNNKEIFKIYNYKQKNNICYHANRLCKGNYNRTLVIGATSNEKLAEIEKSDYLKMSLEKLSTMSGDLIIYGCSMDVNDQHIWNAINNNKSENIYVGTCLGNKSKLCRIQSLFPNKKIKFYCHHSFNIWKAEDWLKNIKRNSIEC